MGRNKDSDKPTNYWARTGYADLTSYEGDTPPSRLSESTAVLRATLSSRNLYTQFKEYPLQSTDVQKVTNTIGTVLNQIAPFNSVDFTDNVLTRLVNTPTTPLVDIGLVMLGKQFTNNFKSNLGQEVYQQINVGNLFDGDPNTTFLDGRDFRITKRDDIGTVENFVGNFFGYNPRRNDPFDNDSTNTDLVQNTGEGQLKFLFGDGKVSGGINRNIYKPNDDIYEELNLIDPRSRIVGNGSSFTNFFGGTRERRKTPLRKYFDGLLSNPYSKIRSDSMADSIAYANVAMDNSYYITSLDPEDGQEYAPDQDFVNENMGITLKRRERSLEVGGSIYDAIGEHDDEIGKNIVWGRDGVDDKANERLAALRGINELNEVDKSDNIVANSNLSGFNVKSGLLEYTRQLLNASEGQVVDQTRKIFKRADGNKGDTKITGLNGSGLWKSPDDSLFKGAAGVRQHSPLDQYDRFAKAIRFDGNQVYAGNPDSVVNGSVMPRIHPTLDKQSKMDVKNLTFSLENLAIEVNVDAETGFGLLGDYYGTRIPKSEVGPFGGRLMWFPPYIESLNEVALANHDTQVMVGRNEPIYSYMHSERTATLTFKLIMDHPPHVRGYETYREMANFFAFGGPDVETKKNTEEKPPQEEPDPPPQPPDLEMPKQMILSFPNDIPLVGTTPHYNIIDNLYNEVKYDIRKGLDNTADTDSYTINDKVFLVTGVTATESGEYELEVPVGFTQSQARYISGGRKLDDEIFRVFKDEENRKYYKIRINGRATVLYTPYIEGGVDVAKTNAYNKALGLRRAQTMESFIKQRIKKVLGIPFENSGIQILATSTGDVGSAEDNNTVESIKEKDAKEERVAQIDFIPITNPIIEEETDENLTPEERREKEAMMITNQNKESTANSQAKMEEFIMEERAKDKPAILKDMGALTKRYFYPAFHSQTPEDFHKRLTFLQQCVRQGPAIRSNPEVDDNGITRVKNSVFGRQPICVLRIGDFFHTKVIINNITIDYDENVWDTNPEGFGMQPMIASVTLQMKLIGGQSLKGPIDALQNAVSLNYYANSSYTKDGMYSTPSRVAEEQATYTEGIVAAQRNKNNE